ncbi:glycosyltransferase family 4 protein [Azovibrio restrictus]|uniref:glycosyltransferase family 4 protein n=1 Tax=Azovibrio restrictus TaxID=146938 RepID=UPI0026EF2133|nr:glycosyltransferase family 4 protein [Azovibrio restrictus]MDD3483387.1 glycosyltransferase family 4 protein [Azovibrio restrictus]
MTGTSLHVLHTESSPSLGGQELRIVLEMEALAARGIDSVLAARPGTPIIAEARQRGLTAYEVPLRFNLDPASMWQLGRIMRRHRIDVLNAHNSKDSWCAAPVARLLGIPVIRARHIANPIRDSRSSKLIYGPLCDAVMTTGEGIKAGLVRRGIPARKIVSVPTGIRMESFISAQPGSLRQDLGIPPEAPLVGQVAVLRGDRGPDIFARAAQIAIEQGSDAWFVLVGDGPARSKVERVLAEGGHGDRIKLAGFRRDIPQVLADLRLFVLASTISEGVAQGVMQAHAASVPVIASHQIGLDEVAIADRTARCVPAKDPQALATAILDLLAQPEEAQRLASAGHALVRDGYTLEHMLNKMEALYRGLMEPA